MVLFRLTRMADYDVGAQSTVRDKLPEHLYLAPVALSLVAPVHHPEHPVGAGLHRQVQPLYYRLLLPDGPQRPVLHVGGMAGREPYPRRSIGHALQKVAEPPAVVPPGVHCLPEERYVPGPALDQPLHLLQHVLHRAAYRASSHTRHYAVAALVVATGHYRDERPVVALRPREIRRVRLPHRR